MDSRAPVTVVCESDELSANCQTAFICTHFLWNFRKEMYFHFFFFIKNNDGRNTFIFLCWKTNISCHFLLKLKNIIGKSKKTLLKDNTEVSIHRRTLLHLCPFQPIRCNVCLIGLIVVYIPWMLTETSGGRGECEHNSAGLLLWEEWR